MHATKEEGMKRGDFLRSLGLSSATLIAYYCLGTTMTSCGSKEDDPTPGGGTSNGVTGTTTGSAINFTIDLNTVTALKSNGGYQVIGDTIVARTTSGSYVALSKICTHEGSTVRYRSAENDFYCPSHESEFSTSGSVDKGPATRPLTAYTTTLSADGNTLTVKA